jgi:hypothetical protein
VKSRATPRFWTAYRELPADVKTAAQQAYRLFRDNPQHPSLHFKKGHKREPIYSVRVTPGISRTRTSRAGRGHVVLDREP